MNEEFMMKSHMNILQSIFENAKFTKLFDFVIHDSNSNNCKFVANQIKLTLPLNIFQRLIVEEILYHVMQYKEKRCEKKIIVLCSRRKNK